MTLRRKLVLAIGLTAVATTVATAVADIALVRLQIEGEATVDLARVAGAIGRDAQDVRRGGPGLRGLRRGLLAQGIDLALMSPSGALEGGPPGLAEKIDLDRLREGHPIWGVASGSAYAGTVLPEDDRGWPPRAPRAFVLTRPVDYHGTNAATAGRVGLAGSVAALIGLLVALILAKRLAAPLGALTVAAGQIAAGDLAARVPVDSDDEFGTLSRAFNDMGVSLEEARRREREFLENVSHELRTPVTAIRGYTEAIEDEASPPAPALAIIREEALRLERMIGDVMNLARLGAGEYALTLVDTDAVEVARAALSTSAVAPAAGVTTVVTATGPVPLRTDPDRLRQVLVNLIENAVRVTTAGSVDVRVGPGSDDGAFIEVVDTGPGIAPTDLPHVFERQYLWHASRADRPVGTGLGLAVVRGLVDALGGTIEVASSPGGTTFRLRVPNRAD